MSPLASKVGGAAAIPSRPLPADSSHGPTLIVRVDVTYAWPSLMT
jgi:hypothetical protein